ncbi:phage tail tape measure protein [Vibrio parahaemolyticus]
MARKLETDIVLNLAGNLGAKARQYGNSMSEFARKNQRAMTLVRTSTDAALRGIDSLGNRYVGLATTLATGATVRNVAAFDAQMTRIGTNAKLTIEQVEQLTNAVEDLSVKSDVRIDATQIAQGLDVLLGKTGDFEFVNENLENMGLFMQAFGADAESTGALFAQFREKGIRDSVAVMNTIDDLYGQFAIGSVSVKDLAGISEQLFATYQGKGQVAISQMSALVQLFAKAKGNANESLTSIQAVFATFSDKQKVQFLNKQGIEVFKEGTKELREPVELLLEVLDAAKNDPLKLGDVFDQTSLQGLASLYSQENKDLLLEMVSGNAELGATQEAAAKNAATMNSAMTSLNNSFNKFANQRLAEPIQELADAINSVDDETIQNWLEWGETALWVVGGLVAAKKGLDLARTAKDVFGSSGKPGSSGSGSFQDLGATPVFVVNMPGNGIGGAGDITASDSGKNGKSSKSGKASSALKGAAAATIIYPVVDNVMDALIGNTDFGKWAKATTLNDLFSSDSDSSINESKVNAYLGLSSGATYQQPVGYSAYGAANGMVKVEVGVSDDRITKKVTSSSPSIQIDPDSGIN